MNLRLLPCVSACVLVPAIAPPAEGRGITPYCFGDGTGTACPCGNFSAAGLQQGCMNSFGQGSHLGGAGSVSVAADTLTLSADHLPTTTTIIFIQGLQSQQSGAGVVVGDGLLCVGSSLIRMGVRTASGGSCSFGFGVAGDPLVSVAGGLPAAGGRRFYQGWYRNNASFCMSEAFNFTSALDVRWTP